MNPIDFLIIYLACGAPFGVYYFLKHRAHVDLKTLRLRSFFNFLFWMPFALSLLRQNLNVKSLAVAFDRAFDRTARDAAREKEIASIEKCLERVLLASRLSISVYGFRETVERYVGLTLAETNDRERIAEHEKELFRIAPTKNRELAALCLHRRNGKRLAFHQTAAREDFLHLIGQLSESVSDNNELKRLSNRLVELVDDFETRTRIENLFAPSMQTVARAAVRNVETDLWKPELRKPSNVRLISRSSTVKATMNLRKKD